MVYSQYTLRPKISGPSPTDKLVKNR